MFRKLKLRWHIYWMAVDNRPLFERLNDYDENGIPYWEKLGTVDPDYDAEQYHWNYVDAETGDAFKVINFGEKND